MKNKVQKFLKIIVTPNELLNKLISRNIIKVKDDVYLRRLYKERTNENLSLAEPKSFNEKLQWLKLYNRKSEYTTMVDKIAVKDYIEKKIGNEYLIPTIGVYDKFSDINFEKLPSKFVIKCNHDSGGIVICKDKDNFNYKSAKKIIRKSFNRNYYYYGREWPYKNIKPAILIEELLENKGQKDLHDYKFFCFNGEPKFIQVDFNRYVNHQKNVYDINWKLLNLEFNYPMNAEYDIKKPSNFQKMLEISKKLSLDIPFVRVDFYEVEKKMYFGEITFFPASGFGKFRPEEWNYKLGDMIKLPNEKFAENEKK